MPQTLTRLLLSVLLALTGSGLDLDGTTDDNSSILDPDGRH